MYINNRTIQTQSTREMKNFQTPMTKTLQSSTLVRSEYQDFAF